MENVYKNDQKKNIERFKKDKEKFKTSALALAEEAGGCMFT
jgi:hypothetical protein